MGKAALLAEAPARNGAVRQKCRTDRPGAGRDGVSPRRGGAGSRGRGRRAVHRVLCSPALPARRRPRTRAGTTISPRRSPSPRTRTSRLSTPSAKSSPKITAFCGCRRISKSATATAAALNFRTNTDCTARAGAAAVCPRIFKYHHRKRYLVLNNNDLREKLIIPRRRRRALCRAHDAACSHQLRQSAISYFGSAVRAAGFLPYTSVGLFLGCALANMISAAGILDVVFRLACHALRGTLRSGVRA